jgi:BMFP domain-containing protein YqiC
VEGKTGIEIDVLQLLLKKLAGDSTAGVDREEFELQKKVLQRSRAKLEALEERIAMLEKGCHGK